MRKLLVLCWVLCIGSVANASVLEVVTYDIYLSEGRLGLSPADRLQPGDRVGIRIEVGYDPYPDRGYPSYDGYLVSSVDIDLHVAGPGGLYIPPWPELPPFPIPEGGFDVLDTDLDSLVYDWTGAAYTPGYFERIEGISLAGLSYGEIIIDNAWFECGTQSATTVLNLTLYGLSEYSPYQTIMGGPYPGGWLAMTEEDLGDLVIYQIPEPMTVALLGVAGIGLLRRRSRQ